MDVNYSRWMSKDPDEPDVIEEEPRRFSLPRPSKSVVASGAMVALIALGGGALARSITTSDVSANQGPTVDATTSDQSSGPGAASVEDAESATTDGLESEPAEPVDESTASDESATSEESAPPDDPELTGLPPDRRQMLRRELRRAQVMRPGPPRHVVVVPWPGPSHLDSDGDDGDDDDS